MKKIWLALVLTFTFLTPKAQQYLELNLGVGYTGIDIEYLVEKDEIPNTIAQDWDTFSYGFGGQYFFTSLGKIHLGAELMYQYLYWYQVRVPFGATPITREYYVDAFKITPIFRFGAENPFHFDVGPQINFAGSVLIGLLASANYDIAINEKIRVPVKLRLDIINNTVFTAPISLYTGIRIDL